MPRRALYDVKILGMQLQEEQRVYFKNKNYAFLYAWCMTSDY